MADLRNVDLAVGVIVGRWNQQLMVLYAPAQSTYVERLKMPAPVAKTKVDIGIKAVQGTRPPDSNCSNPTTPRSPT
ncbi:MAG: hypothetical protein IPO44_00065 [Candidatus Microthrix sp.]|nr:hypothetical protein [Candidatus Microthrix sp.]MBK9558027.1 hypothetical protein [Candidatus Microthrix sp.]